MPLQTLPNEVLCRIFHETTLGPRWVAGDREDSWQWGPGRLQDIKRLRLSCRQFHSLCTARLFETVSVCPEPNPFYTRISSPFYDGISLRAPPATSQTLATLYPNSSKF